MQRPYSERACLVNVVRTVYARGLVLENDRECAAYLQPCRDRARSMRIIRVNST